MKTQNPVETTVAAGTQAAPRKRRSTRAYSAREKSQAVLALWAGRRTAGTLAREMGVPWMMLRTWEKRALTGMLGAFSPAGRQDPQNPLRLPGRLERLLEETTPGSAVVNNTQEN